MSLCSRKRKRRHEAIGGVRYLGFEVCGSCMDDLEDLPTSDLILKELTRR